MEFDFYYFFNLSLNKGVLIAVKNNLSSCLIKPINAYIEQLFVKIKLPNEEQIVGTVYIPPKTSADVSTKIYLLFANELLDLRLKYPKARLIITGDFNLPKINWKRTPNLRPSEDAGYDVTAIEFLVHSIDIVNLYQCNFNVNDAVSLLDLIFWEDQPLDIQVSDDLLIEIDTYHPALYFNLTACSPPSAPTQIADQYDFSRGDYDSLNYFLNDIDWATLSRP